MPLSIPCRMRVLLLMNSLIVLSAVAAGQERPDLKVPVDKTSASRLRAVREIMGQIAMTSLVKDVPQPLELKPDPLLRYNDATRGIADSVVFRVGIKGRPVALISAELYGRDGQQFLLNHEFVALHEPKLRMKRDAFEWEPSNGNLVFQELPAAESPAEAPRQRLIQMRRLAEKFTASQTVGDSQIVLRRMPTPLDRYEPSENARADGAIFAYAWGVNPEAALFLESDGQKWIYAWAPLSSAPLEARLNNAVIWNCPPSPHENREAAYTSIHRQLSVPDYFDDPAERDAKSP